MVLQVRGTAHPPPGNHRLNVADLNRAEIRSTNMGGLPVHVEHETCAGPVGRVQTSWAGAEGELRIAAVIDDPATESAIRRGEMRGLSLGTEVVQREDTGDVLRRAQAEVSVCGEPRRPGCFVDTINGAQVHERHHFSKSGALNFSP